MTKDESTSKPPSEARQNLVRASERLAALMNENPTAAVAEARAIKSRDANWMQLRATALCDAGAAIRDSVAVAEAAEIFARLRDQFPENGGLAYNLANALAASATLDRTSRPDWYLVTADARRRGRAHLGQAAEAIGRDDSALASQAMTNLGNSLDAAYRWIEAFEAYQRALELYPENGVASGCAAEMLFRISADGVLGHRPHLADVAKRLAQHAKTNRDTVIKFAGPAAVKAFERLPGRPGGLARADLGEKPSAYERFVARNRLLLSPIVEGLDHDKRRWDDAHVRGIREPASAGAKVPPLFAMFNVMKGDYLVARELLFAGVSEGKGRPRDTGLYFDTLDYAVYGATPSRLVLAQRTALDLLDKVAVALNDYFSFGEKPKNVHFHNFWREKPKEPRWRPALAAAIAKGNPALIALSEIAADLSDGSEESSIPGRLSAEKRARHAGTHRFIVLHDIASGEPRPNPAIEHQMLRGFRETAIRTVRLSRAALLYFLEAIAHEERNRRTGDGLVGTMEVHPHHKIRGQR
jgi:tetratricopeptide (TPR) repeat protein